MTEERINSDIEILRSKDVADAVVDPSPGIFRSVHSTSGLEPFRAPLAAAAPADTPEMQTSKAIPSDTENPSAPHPAEPLAKLPLQTCPAGATQPNLSRKPELLQTQPALAPVSPIRTQEQEPRDPVAKPRLPLRYEVPEASQARLSPSQRAAERRPLTTRDRNGRVSYVTYTVNPERTRLPNAG